MKQTTIRFGLALMGIGWTRQKQFLRSSLIESRPVLWARLIATDPE